MEYQKPALFLVGAAQGLVLGGAEEGDLNDNGSGGQHGPNISREFGW
jgi:hypothetical protein